jgi:triosephosphate isomerase
MATTKKRGMLIAGNWKMNMMPADAQAFFEFLFSPMNLGELGAPAVGLFRTGTLQAAIFPPALTLEKAITQSRLGMFKVAIGAQNAHWEKSGAFTGEISGPMLADIGVKFSLVGHSERRQHFGETNESAKKRTESLLAQGFKVIHCIGETKEERDAGKTFEVLKSQLESLLPNAQAPAALALDGKLIFAYEPVWAIGTGVNATPAQIQEAHAFIRDLIKKNAGDAAAEKTPLLYGGSVTVENADAIFACDEVDGALVGGTSLKADQFLKLLSQASKTLL